MDETPAKKIRLVHRIWDGKERRIVGREYKDSNKARRRADLMDNEYGAYRYTVRTYYFEE